MQNEGSGKLFAIADRLSELVILGILWILCSLPIITIGPASAALYLTVRQSVRGGEGNAFRIFFQGFKANFKKGWMVSAVYALLLCGAAGVCLTAAGQPYAVPAGVVGVLVLSSCLYCFPIMARFDLSVLRYFQAAIFFSVHYLGKTLLLLVTLALCLMVFWILPFLLPILVSAYSYYCLVILDSTLAEYECV